MNDEFYTKDGKSYERVTRILDYFAPPELVDWKVRVGKKEASRVSKVATTFGTRVHSLIELSEAPKKSDKEEVKNCIQAFNSWKTDYGISEIKNGVTMFCDKRMIAGTPDFMIGNTLVDIKTSREVKATNFIQLGAYASLMSECPKSLAILRLDKTIGVYEYVTNEKIGMTVTQCIDAFNYILGYYRFYKMVQSTLKPNRAMPETEEV